MTADKVFTYQDGQLVIPGDRVLVDNRRMATVELVLQPGTAEAKGWACEETGGMKLKFDDNDCWVCSEFDEDFKKVIATPPTNRTAGR